MVSFLNSVGIDPPNFDLANRSELRGRELLPTSDLTNRRHTMARDRVQERGKPSTSHDHVMAGERDPNFVIAHPLRKRIGSTTESGLLRENDFQRRDHRISAYGPR